VTGPLDGIRIVELAGQGPAPFACMLMSDLGADVVTVEKVDARPWPADVHGRGRRSVCVDVKDSRGADIVLDLAAEADVVVEGFRPGVAERLGIGPKQCIERNPRLVYARMTGWGQDGALAQSAGHDINYLALSGALHAIGPHDGPPVPPLNLVADYGAGGMLLALGVTAAVVEQRASGRGQVVDIAMVDGLASMLAPFHAMSATGAWTPARGSNLLDGGAPCYGVYETADHKHVAVGALEPIFYRELLDVLGVAEDELGPQMDRSRWPAARQRLADVFVGRTRDEWVEAFAGRDACFSPVLDLEEARTHEHAQGRGAFAEVDGVPHPVPVPRYSRTSLDRPSGREPAGESTDAVLTALGRSPREVAALRSAGVVS
jgi:alpha-methylacyl-CoA racemase